MKFQEGRLYAVTQNGQLGTRTMTEGEILACTHQDDTHVTLGYWSFDKKYQLHKWFEIHPDPRAFNFNTKEYMGSLCDPEATGRRYQEARRALYGSVNMEPADKHKHVFLKNYPNSNWFTCEICKESMYLEIEKK